MESMAEQLTNMTRWAQEMLDPVLRPGCLAVDLTAGNGFDTLFLWRGVGPSGTVLAFDVQAKALEHTELRLREAGADVCRLAPGTGRPGAGVNLVHACHTQLRHMLADAPTAVMANLGYLPGGDHALITTRETTLQALADACSLLVSGGRLAVTAYPGHAGGDTESRCVRDFFAALDTHSWMVLELRSCNRPRAPFLLVAEKRSR